MIVCQLLPSGFTFAQASPKKALDEARERAKTWPSAAVRLYDWRGTNPDRGAKAETLTVPL